VRFLTIRIVHLRRLQAKSALEYLKIEWKRLSPIDRRRRTYSLEAVCGQLPTKSQRDIIG